MKLLTFAIPCYNSQDYMENCIKSLLPGGDDVEILIIDDGSKDSTGDIADAYEKKYPGIIRAIHQVNGGHGEAVNAGIRNATGLYFKVVDSDDWVDEEAYKKILDKLRELTVLSYLKDSSLLKENGIIIVEASLDTAFDYLPDMGFTLKRLKTYKTNEHAFIIKNQ